MFPIDWFFQKDVSGKAIRHHRMFVHIKSSLSIWCCRIGLPECVLEAKNRNLGKGSTMKSEKQISKNANAKKTHLQTMALRQKYRIPPMSKAIRLYCLDCVCGSSSEVRQCAIPQCSLWPYRLGRQPRPDDLIVPEYDKHGNLTGFHEYEGFVNGGKTGQADSQSGSK